jgi:hypothetical protein
VNKSFVKLQNSSFEEGEHTDISKLVYILQSYELYDATNVPILGKLQVGVSTLAYGHEDTQ